MYDKILEHFPKIKNRIVSLSDEDLLLLAITYGPDVVPIDIDVHPMAYSKRFGGGVLFRLRIENYNTVLTSRIYEESFNEVLGKFDSCLIKQGIDAGSFSRIQPGSHFAIYVMNKNLDIFNDFWRLNPNDHGYIKKNAYYL